MSYPEWKESLKAGHSFRYGEDKELVFNEKAPYKVDYFGFSKEVNKGLSKACMEVAKLGSKSKKEHLCLVDLETGEIIYRDVGERESVGGEAYKSFVKTNKKKYAFVHNHNTPGQLSEGDITSLLTTQNMNVMIAVENSGQIYFVKKNNNKVLTKPLQLQYYDEVNKIRKECMLDDNRIFLKEREQFIVDKAIKDFCEAYRIYGKKV